MVDDEAQNDTNLICDCLRISPFSNVHDRRLVRRLMFGGESQPLFSRTQDQDQDRLGYTDSRNITVTITFLQADTFIRYEQGEI